MNFKNPKDFSLLLVVLVDQVSQVIYRYYAIFAFFLKNLKQYLLIHRRRIALCFYSHFPMRYTSLTQKQNAQNRDLLCYLCDLF